MSSSRPEADLGEDLGVVLNEAPIKPDQRIQHQQADRDQQRVAHGRVDAVAPLLVTVGRDIARVVDRGVEALLICSFSPA